MSENKEKITKKNKTVEQKKVQKPVEIIVEETKVGIVELLKQSKLPPFIITMLMENLLIGYRNIEKEHLEQAKKVYDEQCK